jgi:hypothetical protein
LWRVPRVRAQGNQGATPVLRGRVPRPNRKSGLIHLIQIIGEAGRQVSREFSDRHPEIPWADIIGMRHKVVHDYLGVDEDIVWQAVTLPGLVALLEPLVPPTPPVPKE